MQVGGMKVWDPLVRIFHWSLVASFAIAWFTSEEIRTVHIWAGYAAAALISFRLIWGFAGTRYARFRQFVRSPLQVLAYLRDILRGNEQRYIGHNPAGGFMILALLACLAGLCFTGWLSTTDAFWGEDWLQETHETIAWIMLTLVLGHVAGVILASVRHHENLVRSMFTGLKRAPAPEDAA